MRCGAFHRVEGTLCLVRHGQAALSGSKTKAPGFAGGYLLRSLALHIGHRKKSKRPLFQMRYSKHIRQFWTWYFTMVNNSRHNIAGTHL
jgi:hypothetical protein